MQSVAPSWFVVFCIGRFADTVVYLALTLNILFVDFSIGRPYQYMPVREIFIISADMLSDLTFVCSLSIAGQIDCHAWLTFQSLANSCLRIPVCWFLRQQHYKDNNGCTYILRHYKFYSHTMYLTVTELQTAWGHVKLGNVIKVFLLSCSNSFEQRSIGHSELNRLHHYEIDCIRLGRRLPAKM